MPPVPTRPPHLAALYALPTRPSDEQIAVAASHLATHVVETRKSVPTKAIAAVLRAHRKEAKLSDRVVAVLTVRATQQLPAQPSAVPMLEREHAPIRVAAKLLGMHPDDLHTRMVEPGQRRLFGWPTWDGRQFWFPLHALRAETRAVFLATLPEIEPGPIAETLPPWCRRQRPPRTHNLPTESD